VTEAPVSCCVKQAINGEYAVNSYISMDRTTAVAFASRYVNERFETFDEYVQASLEDFLNLQNGLFTVNISNDSSTELTLTAPEHIESSTITFSGNTLYFPILYSFGRVEFFLEKGRSDVQV
jgi:CheY-specific phosphatase CheX